MRRHAFLAGLAATFLPLATAQAQSAVAPEDSALDGDYLMVGVGGIYGPSYDGSDDYVFTPVPVVQGRLAGVEITPRPGGLALDLIPDGKGARIGLSLGPVVSYSGNRKRQIEDPVVRSLGKLDAAIELGANAGVTVYRLLHAYDSLTASVDVEWDVNGAHGGMTITPQLGYFTPLSRAAFVNFGLSARYSDTDYADYYFSVSPAQATASGLPAFQADGGWTKAGVSLLAGYDLDGNLLNGGFSLYAIGSYSRMLEDAKRTPFTSIRGDADQWLVGVGAGYTF